MFIINGEKGVDQRMSPRHDVLLAFIVHTFI